MALYRLPTRRGFLRQSIGSAAAAAGLAAMAGQARAQAPRALWALLSDIHIPTDPLNEYRGFRPYENLKRIAPVVAESGVDGALVNGDIARLEGLPGDYSNVKTLLAPVLAKIPLAMSLGNHDHRKNFAATFAESPGEEQAIHDKHVVVTQAGPVRLVILDSMLRTNLVSGLLGKEQRVWLEQYLPSAGSTPILVFMHHTPGDRDGDLLDTDRLLGILTANRNVKALIYGHSHRYAYDQVKGMHLINIPAIGYNFNDSEPVGWVHAEFGADGADFRLHAFGGNQANDGKLTSLAWRG